MPVKGMRKTIASRMLTSLQTMAQLTMDMDVNMDDAVKLRQQLINEWSDRAIKPSYTDLVVRAVAKALENHPRMNATFDENEITLLGSNGRRCACPSPGITGHSTGHRPHCFSVKSKRCLKHPIGCSFEHPAYKTTAG